MAQRIGKGFLNQKKENRRKAPVNSVVSPPAQYRTLLHADYRLMQFQRTIETYCNSSLGDPLILKLLVWVMYHSGCRVNEVLRIKTKDVSIFNDVKIPSSKGSNERIVRIPLLQGLKITDICKSDYLFADYNRYYLYRCFKRNGLYLRKSGAANYSVTHSFRVIYAHSLLSISKKSKSTATAIGHKGIDTIDYYGKEIE